MSKSIKVSETVYGHLLRLQRPRETFSEIISRLIKATMLLSEAEPLIRKLPELFEDRERKANEAKAALARGDSPEVSPQPNIDSLQE